MIKVIVLALTLVFATSCSTISKTDVSREVPTITFEGILSDSDLKDVVTSLDEPHKVKFRVWINDKLIPYVSYLENELQYSTPAQ